MPEGQGESAPQPECACRKVWQVCKVRSPLKPPSPRGVSERATFCVHRCAPVTAGDGASRMPRATARVAGIGHDLPGSSTYRKHPPPGESAPTSRRTVTASPRPWLLQQGGGGKSPALRFDSVALYVHRCAFGCGGGMVKIVPQEECRKFSPETPSPKYNSFPKGNTTFRLWRNISHREAIFHTPKAYFTFCKRNISLRATARPEAYYGQHSLPPVRSSPDR